MNHAPTHKLILSAYTSNSAGGRTGLISLLKSLPAHIQAVTLVDQRMEDLQFPNVKFIKVAPTLRGRWQAELKLRKLAGPKTFVLRLGSVPPLFRLKAYTYVFFENRHLLSSVSLEGMPFKKRLRVYAERFLVRALKHHATTFLVQTESMADGLRAALGENTVVQVRPFQGQFKRMSVSAKDIDFIFPATGDRHKNHHNLIEAWVRLAQENIRPSLLLTIDALAYPRLTTWMDQVKREYSLNIINLGFVNEASVENHYNRCRAMIFPSTCESFGRPLLEASHLGIPIVASEIDCVRDVIDPQETFDPTSPRSIERAVKRFLGLKEPRCAPLEPANFLAELSRQANV